MKQNFKLTKDQQTLVEKNLSIVHWVIVNNIHVNPGICGLEYGDLFQEGCLWLCKAAFTYHAGQAQFSTYAKKVVKNGLLSYCRKICSQGRHISRLIIGDQGELAADGEQLEQPDDHFDSHLSRLETLDLLEASKQNYQGVARLGIEALALKVQGMRITDIAALYQVPPSHYFNSPSAQKFSFSTIATRQMKFRLYDYFRTQERRKRNMEVLSIHVGLYPDGAPLEDTIPAHDPIMQQLEMDLLLHELAGRVSKQQMDIVHLKQGGYGIREIARTQKVPMRRIKELLAEVHDVLLDICYG